VSVAGHEFSRPGTLDEYRITNKTRYRINSQGSINHKIIVVTIRIGRFDQPYVCDNVTRVYILNFRFDVAIQIEKKYDTFKAHSRDLHTIISRCTRRVQSYRRVVTERVVSFFFVIIRLATPYAPVIIGTRTDYYEILFSFF